MEQTMLYDKELAYRGLKITPARILMLEVLSLSEDKLLDASQIYDLVREKKTSINFSTIYRNLELFVQRGLLEKITLENGVKYKLYKENDFCHHMICKNCHKTEPLPYCPMHELEESLKKDSQFLPIEHIIIIYGYCKDCRNSRS